MALTVERMKKVSAVMTLADAAPATVNLSKLTKISKINEVTVGVPGDLHVGVPIGPEAKEYQIEFSWNMANQPAGNHTYEETLKNWTCNSIYRLTPSGATADDISTYGGQLQYFIPRNVTTTRDKTGMAGGVLPTGGYRKWMVSMNLIKLRNEDVTDCPDFEDVMPSNPYAGDPNNYHPMFKMTELRYGDSITTKLTKIVVKHTGNPQAFALYDEEAIAILPPLGNIGPVIDIDFKISSDTDFQLIKMWGATRSLIVGVDQVAYPEFDIDNPPTFYSKWIGSNINVSRPIGSAVASGTTYREVSMSLTRYWSYNIIELI